MKKVIISNVLAFAMVAGSFAGIAHAAGYVFSNYLTVGSTGADVVALQSWLVSNNFLTIPAGVAEGYFGSLTKAAVVAYQASVGLPNTGYVGPLTVAKLNGGAVALSGGSTGGSMYGGLTACPAGWSCPGAFGTGSTGSTGSSGSESTGIMTPGVAGSLSIAVGSFTGNGTVVNDGQAVDVASFDLQAGASDQAVSSVDFDFGVRPWLYISSFSVYNAATGATLATVSNLTAANFTELVVGSEYRLTIPVSGLVVKAGTKTTVVLHAQFATSNRLSTSIYVTRAEVRSIDGTNVTTTQNIGTGIAPYGGLSNYVSYGGQNNSNLIVTIDPSSPNTGIIQTNTGTTQTTNVLLGIFDLKSQNIDSTLQSLTVGLNMTGNGSVGSTFANVQLKTGSTLLTSGTIASPTASTSNVTFTNFNLRLPANTYVPVSVFVTVNGGVTGITASTSLTVSSSYVGGIDANSNPLTVSGSGTLPSSNQQFVLSGATLAGTPTWTINPTVTGGNFNRYPGQTGFSGSFTVTAGSNPLYISTTPTTALTLATSSATVGANITVAVSGIIPQNGVQSYDSPSASPAVYQITPGSSRTFTVSGGILTNTAASSSAAVQVGVGVTSINLNSSAGLGGTTALPINFNLQALNSDFHSQVFLGGNTN